MRPLLGLAAWPLLAALGAASPASTAPAFVWGAGSFSLGASRTVLEAVPASTLVEGLLPGLVSGRVGEAAQPLLQGADGAVSRADTLVVFVSKQLAAQQQTLSQLSDELAPLQAALEAAPSSLTLTHVTYRGAPNVGRAVQRSLGSGAGAPEVVALGDCGEGSGGGGSLGAPVSVEAFQAALGPSSQQKVVVVCPSEASLPAETALLQALLGAAPATPQRSTAWAYLAQPSAAALAQARRRELLAGEGLARAGKKKQPKFVCDALCETQVKLLEGAILTINVLAALWVGSWMLHQLGTPTRFEAPKDQGSRPEM